MPDDLLLWEPTDHEDLPVVCETSEPVLYAMLARGVPEIIADKQNFVKDTMDNEGARGQLGSNPPFKRSAKQHVGIKPGIEMYAKTSGQAHEGSEFLKVPVVDQGALKMLEKAELLVEQYYFRSIDTAPEDKALFVESVTFASLRCYKEFVRLLWRLVQENVGDLQVSRINGRNVRLNVQRDQLQGEADISIGIHLDGYSKEGAERFMKMAEKIKSLDAGNVDWNEVTNMAAQMLSPTHARRLIIPAEAANGKAIDEQETRIAKIMAGIPIDYPERVANPSLRMQVLMKWAQMPGNMARAQADPQIAELFNKEYDSLEFHEAQQNENPIIGRTGVKPN
jgi:hypothetical protein